MKRLDKLPNIIVLATFFVLMTASYVQAQRLNEMVEPDTYFTDLFARDSRGFTGADGIYSVLLPNGQSCWVFGDTFLGEVKADGSREKIDPIFVRNAIAVQDGEQFTTYAGKSANDRDASFIIPPNAPVGVVYSEDSTWFWPGDGYVEGNSLKLFLSSFYQASEGGWGFQWTATWIASFSLQDFTLERLKKIDIKTDPEIHWGHAVCDEDPGYLYVYGSGKAKPYVARIPKNEDGVAHVSSASNWSYYAISGWTDSVHLAEPMVDFEGSEQFSVFKLQDSYVYLSQKGGFSKEIYTHISKSPYGPWLNPTSVYEVASFENDQLFAYNALAHPQFTKDGKLLVSYCVNSFRMEDVFEDASNYRARFIRVPIKLIMGN